MSDIAKDKQYFLEIKDLSLDFGGIRALDNVSFGVPANEILAIIGPNGAGKTSLINCITGFYHGQSGKILFEDKEIQRLSPQNIVKLGLCRTFQNLSLFPSMSVLDNIMAARHTHIKYNALTAAVYFRWAEKSETQHRRRVEEIIDFMEIEDVRKESVAALPYGVRKRVELAKTLALEPRLLLLDEPMAGMSIEEKEDMARFIFDVHERQGTPIVLIEHDMGLVMDISTTVIVMDFGKKIAEGSPSEIQANPEVIKSYLGTD